MMKSHLLAVWSGKVFPKLLLLVVVLMSAYADENEYSDSVTWSECKQEDDNRGRVIETVPDNNATDLDLMDCYITEIKIGDIADLPNIKIIYLSNNKLEQIDPAVFDSCRYLKELYLLSNRLREVPAFGEHSSFPEITSLDVSSNRITKIDNPRTFSAKLQSISLDYNPIVHLHPDIFKGLPDLNRISLSNTRIGYIGTLFQVKSLKKIYLGQSLIEYVPSDAFYGTKLEELNLEGNRISYLPANFVTNLNTTGSDLEIYFYSNPFNCACLLQLLAEVKRIGVREYGAVDFPYDERDKRCVFTGWKCYRNPYMHRRIRRPMVGKSRRN